VPSGTMCPVSATVDASSVMLLAAWRAREAYSESGPAVSANLSGVTPGRGCQLHILSGRVGSHCPIVGCRCKFNGLAAEFPDPYQVVTRWPIASAVCRLSPLVSTPVRLVPPHLD